MDHNPDIINVMTRDRITDLFATATGSRRGIVPIWRRLAGAALVRLGTAILGPPRPTTPKVSLGAAGISR